MAEERKRKYLIYPVKRVIEDVASEVALGNVENLAISYKDKNGDCHSCLSSMDTEDLYDLVKTLKSRAHWRRHLGQMNDKKED